MAEQHRWYEFYEELGNHDEYLQESLELSDPEAYQGGLTHENVRKLTEDLLNPLPPSDTDNHQ
jgi:hypothetical protein